MASYRLNELKRRLLLLRKGLLHSLNAANNKQQQRVVFVAGVQRSGTNMMMDVLERSFETDVYHERDSRAFDNYQMRDVKVIQPLVAQSKAPCFIVKSLCELQRLSRLMDEFKIDESRPAKMIWVNRHYFDVVSSMLVSFRNQANQVKRIAADRHSDGWLSGGLSDETYEHIQMLVHPDISDASAAALTWYFRGILFFEQGFDTDPRVQLVQYETLVTEPQAEFARIFGFLGLEYSQRVSSKVFGSSVRRRSPPEIDAPILALCSSLATRFETVAEGQRSQFRENNQ